MRNFVFLCAQWNHFFQSSIDLEDCDPTGEPCYNGEGQEYICYGEKYDGLQHICEKTESSPDTEAVSYIPAVYNVIQSGTKPKEHLTYQSNLNNQLTPVDTLVYAHVA